MSSKGFPGVALFTSLDRSTPIQRQHSEYQTCVLVAFTWVVQAAPPGVGLIVNPGWSVTIEQPPEGLAAFKATLGPGAQGRTE